jgi:hypothetical protein
VLLNPNPLNVKLKVLAINSGGDNKLLNTHIGLVFAMLMMTKQCQKTIVIWHFYVLKSHKHSLRACGTTQRASYQ